MKGIFPLLSVLYTGLKALSLSFSERTRSGGRIMRKVLFSFLLLFLTVSAAEANISVIGGLTREAEVQPGGQVEGRIIIKNNSDTQQRVEVEVLDYFRTVQDGAQTLDAGTLDRSSADWFDLEQNALTVSGNDRSSFLYSIDVPSGEDISGTYWHSVRVVPEQPVEVEQPEDQPEGVQVGVRTKLAYRLNFYTHISGRPGTTDISFIGRDLLVTEQEGERRQALAVAVQNDGSRLVKPNVWMELLDSNGQSLGRFSGPERWILPSGGSRQYNIDLSGVPPGEYEALLVVDTGNQSPKGARYSFEIPEEVPEQDSDDSSGNRSDPGEENGD